MLWTAFASVFSLLLGYSRVPYAAAVDGDYFPVFARVHPKHQFPHVSLLVLGSGDRLLPLPPCRRRHRARRDSHRRAVPRADDRHHRAADTPPRFPAAVQDVAVSGAGAARVSRLHLHGRHAAEVDRINSTGVLVVIVGTVLFWIRQRQATEAPISFLSFACGRARIVRASDCAGGAARRHRAAPRASCRARRDRGRARRATARSRASSRPGRGRPASGGPRRNGAGS